MNKSKSFVIISFVLVLFILSFGYGYYLMGKRIGKKPFSSSDKIEKPSEQLEIVKENEIISPNTFIEKKIYYKKCNHIITDTNLADDVLINKTEEEFKKYMEDNYPNVKITTFTPKRILLREERNHLCPDHYIIGESDGKIAIFKIDESGEKVLDKVFNDCPIDLLKDIDQEKLKEGIIVDSEEELSDVLENFIS